MILGHMCQNFVYPTRQSNSKLCENYVYTHVYTDRYADTAKLSKQDDIDGLGKYNKSLYMGISSNYVKLTKYENMHTHKKYNRET
jgi:hypothetical protein